MSVYVAVHKNGDEFVIRLHGPTGYAGLGTANGREEADMLVWILHGALELHYQSSQLNDNPDASWCNGMKNADNIAEGHRLVEFARQIGIEKGGA